MKAILIAEKPSLMRDIRNAYNKSKINLDIDFFALRGHVYTLKEPEDYKPEWKVWKESTLPIIPDEFGLKSVPGTTKVVKPIKDALKGNDYDFIINACDAAREGELIFYNLYESLPKKYQIPVKRFWASDVTETSLKKALNSLIDGENEDLVNLKNSAKLRARWDWILGLNFTRLFTIASGHLSVVGRVVTPTLKLVTDRLEEIEKFKSRDFFEYQGYFKLGKDEFIGRYENKTGLVRLESDKDFKEIYEKTKGKPAKVISVEKKESKSYAPPIYNLTDLQRDANKLYKYSPKETLNIAQALYEKHKILSYPRTESRYIPTAVAKDIADYLKEPLKVFKKYEKDINKDKIKTFEKNKRYVDNSKITDHHGLLPTLSFKESDLKKLNDKELKVFNLVLERFVSIFFDDYVEEKTTAYIDVEGYKFRCTGTTVVDLGFRKLWKTKTENALPKLTKGDTPDFLNLKKETFKTKPPLMFTKGTLLDAMENVSKDDSMTDEDKVLLKGIGGLGTSATRADIIEKLFSNGYLEMRKNFVYPTKRGTDLINMVRNYSFSDAKLTASWEKELKKIEDGERDYKKSMEDFIKFMEKETEDIIEQTKERMSMQEGGKIGVCPKCGRDVLNRRFAYSCEDYKSEDPNVPPCDFSIGKVICEAEITEADIKKMLEGGKSSLLHMKFKSGNEGDVYLSLNDDGSLNFEFYQEPVGKCPKCGKDIIETKKYFMCKNYKKEDVDDPCDFIMSKSNITKKELQTILDGGETGYKKVKFKSGTYEVKFKIENGDVKYLFKDK